jgi:hypothetical protein
MFALNTKATFAVVGRRFNAITEVLVSPSDVNCTVSWVITGGAGGGVDFTAAAPAELGGLAAAADGAGAS